MTVSFRQARDSHYAERLIHQNMAAYYAKLQIRWDSASFERNWSAFENYEICVNGQAVDVLCLSHDDVACYIRDLHVEPAWQGRGLGTEAVHYATGIAKESGIRTLRLRVFEGNPAVSLYERLGFRIVKSEDDTHYMQWMLSPQVVPE
ncbi:GNAT family N-acetyltransferase [Marinobacter nanhaiticus D15-8W]|uniref:GNAT family N-acetyltransferase n=2 Tax=Marinobacter TaxID=2742 RepID=N6VRR7_9GAMM|nr:GNAT family N-acetyltransferase [Marinobacter nanhaiticus D15-8W]